ncbi:MAG: transcriptional regulator [Bacteroidetes bacterium GWB2_41_8]|nr:MAG: transcriptional regulator [Bacteroidetes bacterium GWB2_41_8]
MKESQNIEWKREWKDEYLKWICGFANAKGGKLYIGIDDNGFASGMSNVPYLLEFIPNKVLDILGIMVQVNLLKKDMTEYLEIIVEPYPFPVNYKGQYFYRTGSTKQELKGNSLNKFLLEKIGKRWDGVEIPNVSPSDLKVNSIERFRSKAYKSNRVDEDILNDSTEVLLEDLQLVESGFLKRAAILLFHSTPERFVQGAYIKIGFFRTDDDLAFQDEVHGSLMEQIDKAEDLLRTKYTVYAIDYEGMSRVEKPTYPEKAIREALFNAIAHKDYSDPTPIQISVYSDHIIFWNPGQLPENWTIETLKKKHASKPFNPSIANALFRCGDIEAWGRGTLKMIKEAIISKSLPPEFNTMPNEFSITFFKDVKTAMAVKGINPELAPVVEYVIENGEITNSIVQKILNVSKPTATRYLNILESVYLSKIGETGVGTNYILKGSQRAHDNL